MNCARCDKKDCYQGKDCTKIKELAISQYQKEELKIVKTSTLLEGNYYMKLARLEELKKFAKLMNYKYLGIAFCIGLSDEAKVLTKVLEKGLAHLGQVNVVFYNQDLTGVCHHFTSLHPF